MNRRNFLKVFAAGALGLLLSKVAPKRQEVVVGVDWADGSDETIVVDWRANQDESVDIFSLPQFEEPIDCWVDNGDVWLAGPDGSYWRSRDGEDFYLACPAEGRRRHLEACERRIEIMDIDLADCVRYNQPGMYAWLLEEGARLRTIHQELRA